MFFIYCNMSKIFVNYILNLSYEILALIVPLITAPYLARVLGPSGTGIYSYVHSVVSLFTSIIMLGIFQYGSRQIAYVRDDKIILEKTFWGIMSTRIIILLIGTILYCIILIFERKYLFYFLLYYSYFLGYCVDCTWLFVGLENRKIAVIKNVIMKLLSALSIFLLIKKQNDVVLYILLQGGSILFANIIIFPQLKYCVGKPQFITSTIKSDLIESAKIYLPSVATAIYLQCDKIMLGNMKNKIDNVSFYDYSEKIITIPLSFIKGLSTVMMPRIANEFYNGNNNNIEKLINKALQLSIFIACPMTLGIISIAYKFIPWYLGNDFSSISIAIIILSPIIISNTLLSISGRQYFISTNQINILLKSQIYTAIFNIFLNALLIPFYGLYGAAISTLFSSILCSVIQFWFLYKQIKIYNFGKNFIKYIMISINMFLLIYYLTQNMPSKYYVTILQIVFGTSFYIIINLIIFDKNLFLIYNSIKSILRNE